MEGRSGVKELAGVSLKVSFLRPKFESKMLIG